MSDWAEIMTERVDILAPDTGQATSGVRVRIPPGQATILAVAVPCSIQRPAGRPLEQAGLQTSAQRSVVRVLFDRDVGLEGEQRLVDLRDGTILKVERYHPVSLDIGLWVAPCTEV